MSLKLLDAQLSRLTKQQQEVGKKGSTGGKKRSRGGGAPEDEDGDEAKSSGGGNGGGKNFLKKARADIKARGQRVEQAVKLATLSQPKKKSRKLLKKLVKLQQEQ